MAWDEALGRLDGSFYGKQVRAAADEYLAKQPEVKISQPGFDRWKKDQES
jgi:hypothetical protein